MDTEHSEGIEGFPLTDSQDNNILMHRDAHFGGSFDFMIDYYKKEGKGICPDFELERIVELANMEKQMNQNLAAVLLSGAEAETVAKSKTAYKALRDLYENKNSDKNARLIADLILAEEEEPEQEIAAIVAEKGSIVRSLIQLVQSEDFHDPLFPGYGQAHLLATTCLGLIGDKRAIISLFESIGTGNFDDENIALAALQAIGEPAKQFLLKVLQGKPLNEDNERAAIALIGFKEDPEVSTACFKMLQEPLVLKDLPLATYLIAACEHLNKTPYGEDLAALAEDTKIPKMLQQDIKIIIKQWK